MLYPYLLHYYYSNKQQFDYVHNYLYLENCTVKGQILTSCAEDPSCAKTCTNRFSSKPCLLGICSTTGVCACPPGTAIDEDKNECVPESECPESKSYLFVFT